MTNTKRAYLALGALCIIWGTTYTAIKYAILDFPPLLLVGIRQSAAGIILLAFAFYQGKGKVPDKQYVMRQALTGLATITGGNGFVTWGMQYISSGIAAIIGSLTPVMVVIFTVMWKSPDKLNARMIIGVLLGFSGLGVIFSHGWADFIRPEYRWGVAGCLASTITWSLGTVMAKRWNSPEVSPLINAGIQVLAGGLGGFVLSMLFDKTWVIHHSTSGWASLIYLTIVGSALAFSMYMFILKHLSATVTSLYTYINPIVALLLGWLLLGETLTIWIAIGMSITITGVWLVNSGSFLAMRKARLKNKTSA